MPSVLNSQSSGWPKIVQYQKNFKRPSLTGKVLSDFRDRAVKELIRKKGCHCPGLLVYNEKMGSWYLSFPFKAGGLAVLQLRAVLTVNPSPRERNGNLLQYSCLVNPLNRRAWGATSTGPKRVGPDCMINFHFQESLETMIPLQRLRMFQTRDDKWVPTFVPKC